MNYEQWLANLTVGAVVVLSHKGKRTPTVVTSVTTARFETPLGNFHNFEGVSFLSGLAISPLRGILMIPTDAERKKENEA